MSLILCCRSNVLKEHQMYFANGMYFKRIRQKEFTLFRNVKRSEIKSNIVTIRMRYRIPVGKKCNTSLV